MSRRLSSLGLLSLMLLCLIGAAMLLMWILSSWVLRRTFEEVGRAVVLDDLGEYAVLYERGGVAGVRNLFTAGEHESDQVVRIVGGAGEVLLDIPLAGKPGIPWPDPEAAHEASEDGTAWYRLPMGDGTTFTIGRRRLPDGAELWFGRTNGADLEAIAKVHRLIALTMGITALLSVGPVVWFSSRVLKPVRRLIQNAHRLAGEDASLQRLQAPGAIAELREFSDAFNRSLDRIQALTDELEAAMTNSRTNCARPWPESAAMWNGFSPRPTPRRPGKLRNTPLRKSSAPAVWCRPSSASAPATPAP